jgi:multidrug efflux pump subunit AcrB
VPEDVKLSYEFDQSVYVINAVKSLISEGAIGAILTGLMVLLFLGDRRGALIVVLTIPTSIISGVLFLYLFGQTINIMTLSGLALAVGILVDESTVTIENIHQHLAMGKPKALAIWDACKEIAFPKLLILLCILAVFAPAFTMTGIPGALFLPLAMAIAFSMITSYFLAQTFVPIMANWMMKAHHHRSSVDGHILSDEEEYVALGLSPEEEQDTWDQKKKLLEKQLNDGNEKRSRFEKLRSRFLRFLDRIFPHQKSVVILYTALVCGAVLLLFMNIGRDVLPKVNGGQFQVRLRLTDGTRFERTEDKTVQALHILEDMVGKENIAVTSAYVGQHPGQFSTSPIYLFMSGPQEAVIQVAMRKITKKISMS